VFFPCILMRHDLKKPDISYRTFFPLHSNKRIETIYFTSFENEDFHNLKMFVKSIIRLLIPSKAKVLLLQWCVAGFIYLFLLHVFEYCRKVKRFCDKYIHYKIVSNE